MPRIHTWLGICCALFLNWSNFAHGAETAVSPPRILVLGDSISAAYGINLEQGWVALMQERINESGHAYKVINGAISGNTTSDGLARLPTLLDTHHPAVVLIELGGNDGLRGYPLKTMRANLAEAVRISQAQGAQVILIGIEIPPNYGKRYATDFANSFTEIAHGANVPLVSFTFSDIGDQDGMLQRDGIHPTALAQPLLLEKVWPALQPLL